MHIDRVSGEVVDSAMSVHSALGPGLLESAYQICLVHELTTRGLVVRREVRASIRYKGIVLDGAYRIDLLVEDSVVVETKSVMNIVAVHEAQLLSQLKLGGYRVGLLINFNVVHLRDGIIRKVHRP